MDLPFASVYRYAVPEAFSSEVDAGSREENASRQEAKRSCQSVRAETGMILPRNVLRFEVLLYVSLMLDALSVAFGDRTPREDMTDSMIMTEAVLSGFIILLLLYFVWLAARRHKNWPRWVLTAALVLSVISLFQVIGVRGVELDSSIEIVSCLLTAAGLYFSYTGDAQGWFNA